MAETTRNTFDWGPLESTHEVQVGKILADEILAQLAEDLGRPLAVDITKPVRVVEGGQNA